MAGVPLKHQFQYRRMAIQIGIALLIVTGLFFLVQNCGQQSQVASRGTAVLKSYGCDCRDLECWRKASDSASQKAFSCAASALSAAATAGSVQVAGSELNGIAAGAQTFRGKSFELKDLTNYLQLVGDLAGLLKGLPFSYTGQQTSLPDIFKAIFSGAPDVAKTLFGVAYATNPGYQCLIDNSATIGGIFDAANNITKAWDGASFDVSVLLASGKGLIALLDSAGKSLLTLDSCLAAITQSPGSDQIVQLAASAKQFSNIFKVVIGPVKIALTLADCGFAIGGGLINIASNGACAVEDVQNLITSRASLASQRDATLERPLQAGDGRPGYECNNEYVGEAEGAFLKYGIFLGKQNFYSYAFRSVACADYCGSTIGARYCEENADAIFGADAANCRQVCNVRQIDNVVSTCISYCCGQNPGCTNDANQRYQTFGG